MVVSNSRKIMGTARIRTPEANWVVMVSGITLHDYLDLSSSFRLRFFGPRDLTSYEIYRSQTTARVNGEVGYFIGEKWRISAEFLNLLDRRDHDARFKAGNEASTSTPERRRN